MTPKETALSPCQPRKASQTEPVWPYYGKWSYVAYWQTLHSLGGGGRKEHISLLFHFCHGVACLTLANCKRFLFPSLLVMQTHHVFTISSSSLAHVWTCLLATLRARWGRRSDLCWVTFAKVRSDICHLQSLILKKIFHTAKCFLSLCGPCPAPTSCEPADVENSTEDSKAIGDGAVIRWKELRPLSYFREKQHLPKWH